MRAARKQDTPSLALDALQKQLAKPRPVPQPLPTKLPREQVKLWAAVFQHRDTRGHASAAHVQTLARVLGAKADSMLAPVTVWWDGRAWACIDGHHRLKAYEAAGRTSSELIPVEVFEGTLAEASERAASGNTQDKLPMQPAEKTNAAWRLICHHEDLSKAAVCRATGVADNTAARMRRALKRLKAQETANEAAAGPHWDSAGVPKDFRDMDWREALATSEGRAIGGEPWSDERTEQRAQEVASKLRKALGSLGTSSPEVFARALEIYSGRLPALLVEHWTAADDEEA